MNFFENAFFISKASNDLVSALIKMGHSPQLSASASEALDALGIGGALFILADGYPSGGTVLTSEILEKARSKQIKIFIEYPESLLEKATDEPSGIVYERLVVAADIKNLRKDSILMVNGCRYRACIKKDNALILLAKVAGYDTIEYGLPDDSIAILGYLDDKRDVLVSATALTNFITARHTPKVRWRALWQDILCLMGAGDIDFDYAGSVTLNADKTEPLSNTASADACKRNLKWITDYMIDSSYPTPMVIEGFASAIDESGNQTMRRVFRGDCTGEVAMMLCHGGRMLNDDKLISLGCKVTDTLFTPVLFYNDTPKSSAYGHINWFEKGRVFYGDDNARALLGAMSVRSLTGESRWDERILRAVFANLRTSDKYGVRCPRLDMSSFKDSTWLDYYNGTMEYISPHYQAYLYATFLWAYQLTGIRELFDKSVSAIEKTMALFPDKLRWQNSQTGEITRMLLPLSILARIDGCEKHIKWLNDAVDATIALQEPCGAVREIFGDMALGKYPPPSSNESYGTTEASLIQNNGDPATDLLYALNWAFIGLWEAYLVLDDKRIKDAYLKLKDFLLRIQLRSEKHPELDGAWMRSFDFEKWEYWGSASDIGWSAWSVETGWTNAWIVTTLALESKNESLFSLASADELKRIAPSVYKEMMTFTPTDETDDEDAKMDGSAE